MTFGYQSTLCMICFSISTLLICPSVCLSVCLSICLSVCLSVCLFVCAGYLCGSCSDGTGVTALVDRCERCSPLHGLLVVALGERDDLHCKHCTHQSRDDDSDTCHLHSPSVVVDTIVILGVMVVSLWKPLHLPSWLYSIFFYIQVHLNICLNIVFLPVTY